jgi:phosphate-selective porin OprO and OprP
MFLYQYKNDPNADAGEPVSTQEVMIRRARVTMVGNMWHKKNKYKVELAVSPKDEKVDDEGDLTQTPLLSWQNTFAQLRDLEFRVGQYKIPYSRERVISSSKLAMVDRTAANKEFNLDRDIGFDIGSKDLFGTGFLQYNVGVYAGEGRGRFEPGDFGLMYLGRINLTPMGTFNDYEQQDFDRGAPRLSVGAAYAYVDQPTGSKNILDGGPADAVYNYHNVTTDLLFKASGLSVEGAFFARMGGEQFEQFAEVGTGYFVQPSMLIPRQPVGVSLRWGQNTPKEGSLMSEKTEVGPGFSWYMNGARNKMKLQADDIRAWGSDGPSEGTNQARLQLQAML